MVQDQVLQPVNLIEHWTGKHLHNVILFWFHMWWIVVWSKAWKSATSLFRIIECLMFKFIAHASLNYYLMCKVKLPVRLMSGILFMTRAKTNTTCCYCARSVPFDDPGYLCLRGWEYFSHFNRELEHVFTHNWNDSVLGFYVFVNYRTATETLSIT